MERTADDLVMPIVHLNGTSAESLLEERGNAWNAINEAYAALRRMAPNARDYYPGQPGLFEQAVAQHTRRLQALHDVMDELEMECDSIADQNFRARGG